MAAKAGALFVKLNGPVGWPDREVIGWRGRHAYVELKGGGGEPSKAQLRLLRLLGRRGFLAYIVENTIQFQEVLDRLSSRP